MENPKYIISYNPYQNKSYIKKNGNMLSKSSRLRHGIDGKRLQEWFDASPSWKGLAAEIADDNRDRECRILFAGRKMDFTDFEYGFKAFLSAESSQSVDFQIDFEELVAEDDLFEKLENLVNELAVHKDIFSDDQIEELKAHLCRLKEDPFKISVLAPMSSGKSTLLNALLKASILPTGDDATTQNIVEIVDTDIPGVFDLEAYDNEGRLVGSKKNASKEDVAEFNTSNIRLIRILGDIPIVNIGKMSLMLRDTPGPNNALSEYHREVTESIISDPRNMSVVIFVLNATNPTVIADKELLERIAYEMKAGGKLTRDRFFFVLNKADLYLNNENPPIENLIQRTREFLLKHFGIEEPRIFPVASKLAKGIYDLEKGIEWPKRELKHLIDDIESFSEDDDEIKLEKYASTSVYVRDALSKKLEEYEKQDDSHGIAMIHSGIPALELSIREYMEKYAYPIKISEAIKDILSTINQTEMERKFYAYISKNESELVKIRKLITKLEGKKGERTERRDATERKIRDLSLDDSILSTYKQKINTEFQEKWDEIEKDVQGGEIEQDKADEIVKKLVKKLEDVERDLREGLKEELQRSFYKKAKDILKEYLDYVQTVREEMGTVPAFDFSQIKDFKTGFQGLEDAAKKVTREEPVFKNVPEERYFIDFNLFGLSVKLFKLDPVWRAVPTGEKKRFVSRSQISEQFITIKKDAQTNIEKAYKEAVDELKRFQDYFSGQIRKLSELVNKTIAEINTATKEESVTELRKKNFEEEKKKLSDIITKIQQLTAGGSEYVQD